MFKKVLIPALLIVFCMLTACTVYVEPGSSMPVTLAQAQETATHALQAKDGLNATDIRVSTEEKSMFKILPGAGRYIWDIYLQYTANSKPYLAKVEIDAYTGEVIILGLSA